MLDELDHTLRDPLYLQLKNALVKAIREGRFGSDGQLPTEHELCEQLGISAILYTARWPSCPARA